MIELRVTLILRIDLELDQRQWIVEKEIAGLISSELKHVVMLDNRFSKSHMTTGQTTPSPTIAFYFRQYMRAATYNL